MFSLLLSLNILFAKQLQITWNDTQSILLSLAFAFNEQIETNFSSGLRLQFTHFNKKIPCGLWLSLFPFFCVFPRPLCDIIVMQISMYAFYFSKVTWLFLFIHTDISSQVMWLYVSLLFLLSSFQTKKKILSKSC